MNKITILQSFDRGGRPFSRSMVEGRTSKPLIADSPGRVMPGGSLSISMFANPGKCPVARPMETPMLARPTDEAFLVRVFDSNFVVEIDGRTTSTTSVPSYALHQEYTSADMLCQDLRRRGYRQVCSHLGKPVSAGDITVALLLDRAPKSDPLLTTHKEFDQISAAEYRRFMQDPTFVARVNELEAQPREAAKARR